MPVPNINDAMEHLNLGDGTPGATKPQLPSELLIMILGRCTGVTILKWRRVSKFFKHIVDTDSAAKRAVFGRLPLNVMSKIIEYATDPSRPNVWSPNPKADQYGKFAPWKRLNSVYNALLHNHPSMQHYLFRGGYPVYSTLKETGLAWHQIGTHCLLGSLLILPDSTLEGLMVIPWQRPEAFIRFLDCPAKDEYATHVPFKRIYLNSEIAPVENEDGVRVIDIIKAVIDRKMSDTPGGGRLQRYGERWNKGCLELWLARL